jgi:hypothetical protein
VGFDAFFLDVRRQHERTAKRAEPPLQRVIRLVLLLMFIFLFTTYSQHVPGQADIQGLGIYAWKIGLDDEMIVGLGDIESRRYACLTP